jgi:hypothetical protein
MFSFVCICTHFYCHFSRSAACVRSVFMLNYSARNSTVVKERARKHNLVVRILKKITRIGKDSEFANISDFHAFFLPSMLKWRLLVISRKHADRHQHFFLFLFFLVALTRSSFVYLLHVTVVFPVFFPLNYQQ